MIVKTVTDIYQKLGYKKIINNLPRQFTWQPDILLRKKDDYIACLIRETDSVPELLIQRIATMRLPNNKLNIFIIFNKKPKQTSIRMISLYGIGIAFINKNKLIIISKSKKFSNNDKKAKKIIIKKKKKPSRIDIFISSYQKIPERKCVKNSINEIRTIYPIPVFPILVEEDSRYPFSKIKECIKKNMDDSDLFIGILAEEYRENVNFEIKRAFNECFKVEDIFIFIKNCKRRSKEINRLIFWIKKQNKVKYLEYTDIKDLRTKVMHSIMIRLQKIYKKKGIPFLE